MKIQKTILIIKQASQYTVAAGLPRWDADVEHEPRECGWDFSSPGSGKMNETHLIWERKSGSIWSLWEIYLPLHMGDKKVKSMYELGS